MSALNGLAAYRARKAEEEARREAAGKPRVQRFNLEKDGDSAVIRFAQEIDYDANNYDEKLGLGFVNLEHTCGADKQNGWKNRANCSIESQGECYPCGIAGQRDIDWDDRKGWKQKEKFYINVIGGEPREYTNDKGKKAFAATDVDRKTGDGTVYLLEQSTHNGIWDSLADYFLEEEVSGGTITDKFFKITRKGSGFNDTSYGITALKEVPADAKSLHDFELYNIKEDVLVEVPFAQQESFYYKGISVTSEAKGAESAARQEASVGAGSTDSSTAW